MTIDHFDTLWRRLDRHAGVRQEIDDQIIRQEDRAAERARRELLRAEALAAGEPPPEAGPAGADTLPADMAAADIAVPAEDDTPPADKAKAASRAARGGGHRRNPDTPAAWPAPASAGSRGAVAIGPAEAGAAFEGPDTDNIQARAVEPLVALPS